MTLRLLLICAARAKRPCFPGVEGLDPIAPAIDAALDWRVPRIDLCWRAPDAMARRTAEWLDVDAVISEELAEIDYGSWRDRPLDEVAREEPEAFKSWIDDPSAAPHGGESFADLMSRVGDWLAACQSLSGSALAIAPASVIRACVLVALRAPPAAFANIDPDPLSVSRLTSDGRRWSVRSFNEPLKQRR